MVSTYISFFLKFFFLLTPFFGLSMFLAMTAELTPAARRLLAFRVAVATIVISTCLFFFGRLIFDVFGITVDAFRIGAGALLFLTAVALMNPREISAGPGAEDISVVPLAMPVIVGPASCGAIMVSGAELHILAEKLTAFVALISALLCMYVILRCATWIEERLGARGISILMRLTALILAALSAQMMMVGVCGFLKIQ